ncbi:MAG: hypothetical protein ABIA63_10075 [bacterium]
MKFIIPILTCLSICFGESLKKPVILFMGGGAGRISRTEEYSINNSRIKVQGQSLTFLNLDGGLLKQFSEKLIIRTFFTLGFGNDNNQLLQEYPLEMDGNTQDHDVRFYYRHSYIGAGPELLYFTSQGKPLVPYISAGITINRYFISLAAEIEDKTQENGLPVNIENAEESAINCFAPFFTIGFLYSIIDKIGFYGHYKYRYWRPVNYKRSFFGLPYINYPVDYNEEQHCHLLELGLFLGLH